jgi:hypothetical protein
VGRRVLLRGNETPGRHGPGFFVQVRHRGAASATMVIPARRHQSTCDRQPPGYRLPRRSFQRPPCPRCEVRHGESVVIRAAEMCVVVLGPAGDTSPFPLSGPPVYFSSGKYRSHGAKLQHLEKIIKPGAANPAAMRYVTLETVTLIFQRACIGVMTKMFPTIDLFRPAPLRRGSS